jgi:hypothetical protein
MKMRISKARLEAQGFRCEWNEKDDVLEIWPQEWSERLAKDIHNLGVNAGLNERNCDVLVDEVGKLQVIQAITS